MAEPIGPLTAEELLALWISVTDPGYHLPIVEAGDGEGLEAIGQALTQHARVSLAVDRTTQAMYLLPWSGQTDEPAGGVQFSEVVLQVSRSTGFARELILTPGQVLLEEQTTDHGRDGPVVVATGRRYAVRDLVGFGPGVAGPISVPAIATVPGYGHNNPLPGTIRRWVQPGVGFGNTGATVVPGVEAHRLQVANVPDVVLPDHRGQYVRFVAGANAGQQRRVLGYEPPNPPVHGGVALLAPTTILRFSAGAGVFLPGERVEQQPGGAAGVFLVATATRIVVDRTAGGFVVGQVVVGTVSGATALIDAIDQGAELVAEAGTAVWEVPGWEVDLGLSATHAQSPTGGRAGWLDELGAERRIGRAPGESDLRYRRRVAAVADVVAPNALIRAANRVLAPFGHQGCLREVGLERLRGIMADAAEAADPARVHAYDLDEVQILVPSPTPTGFFDGERVVQTHADGTIATGRATLRYAVPAGPLPQPLPAPTIDGVVAIRGTFVTGEPIVGQASGASVTPASLGPGLTAINRYKVHLDYTEFRAFFLLGVPALVLGEFGLAYDAGGQSAYDIPPWDAYYDGQAATAASLYRQVWQALEAARAGGVGFDLVLEVGAGCI